MIHHIKLVKDHEDCQVKIPKPALFKIAKLGYKKDSPSKTLQAFLDEAFKGLK